MIDLNIIIGLLGTFFLGILGHGIAIWHRIGKIEGKMDILIKLVNSERGKTNGA